MEIIRPTDQQVVKINGQRDSFGDGMQSEDPARAFLFVNGVCSVDLNAYPDGRLGAEVHAQQTYGHLVSVEGVDGAARFNDTKPRTGEDEFTGILHQHGGSLAYTGAASRLTDEGVPLASEVMDESDLAIAGPWLSVMWYGARNLLSTGTRYLGRQTDIDLKNGIHPAPVLIKNGQNGFEGLSHAIKTVTNRKEVTRTRLTLAGPQEITTYGNPNVGVILRGIKPRPEGPIENIIRDEVVAIRGLLAADFPDKRIPVFIDISHDHAKMEGGGEAGQWRVAVAIANLLHDEGLDIDGMLMETNRFAGKQAPDGKVVGLSVTDECMSEINARKAVEMTRDAWLSRKAA